MPTPTPAEIAAAVQAADDLASVAAGQLTDAQALADKDAQISARDDHIAAQNVQISARDTLIASLQAKIATGKTSAQATLTALS